MMDITVIKLLSTYSMANATPAAPHSVAADPNANSSGDLRGQHTHQSDTAQTEGGENLERRRGQRTTIATPIEVALLKGGEPAGSGKIRDIALHGMFIETDTAFPKNAYLQLRFTLAGEDAAYHPWGNVVHRANGGIGLAMDVLEPRTQGSLEAVENYAKGHSLHE